MPDTITTILISEADSIGWTVTEQTHEACGKTCFVAETADRNMTLSATSLNGLAQFAIRLLEAIGNYHAEIHNAVDQYQEQHGKAPDHHA